jgi:hypothetical protein
MSWPKVRSNVNRFSRYALGSPNERADFAGVLRAVKRNAHWLPYLGRLDVRDPGNVRIRVS